MGLQAEQEEKEQRKKEKAEAHLYTLVRVSTDADLAQQIGSSRFFDLVDHDKASLELIIEATGLGKSCASCQQVDGPSLIDVSPCNAALMSLFCRAGEDVQDVAQGSL